VAFLPPQHVGLGPSHAAVGLGPVPMELEVAAKAVPAVPKTPGKKRSRARVVVDELASPESYKKAIR
jgi:hypothetical protein